MKSGDIAFYDFYSPLTSGAGQLVDKKSPCPKSGQGWNSCLAII